MELARFVKRLVPGAHIFGTSTSAIINRGRVVQDRCVVSVTQLSRGHVKTATVPAFDPETGEPVPPETLCESIRAAAVDADTKLLLTFLTGRYLDVYRLVERCNDCFPGVQMTGGVANTADPDVQRSIASGFVFDESGWSNTDVLLAAFGGGDFECLSSYAVGAQPIGDELEITDAFGTCILALDGKEAAREYRAGIGDMLRERPELANLFPYVYAEPGDIPAYVHFTEDGSLRAVFAEDSEANRAAYRAHSAQECERRREMILANHNVDVGRRLRRAFIYDTTARRRRAPTRRVPIFSVLDGCTVENLFEAYGAARVEMSQKNIQFCVRDAGSGELDENAIRERYRMVNVINYAITHDKIIPYYQGIYDNRLGRIHHYESLMRLEDETGRVYEPGEFLDVARSFGLLYDSISGAMVRKVFERFKNSADTSVSVNLGLRDIKNRELTGYIYDFLSSAEKPGNFVFEILENEDVDDYEHLIAFVDKIHNLGGRISIDDFGSGYSNLQHVVSIRSDYLKIDGSIVSKCCDDMESENLIALIASWRDLSPRKVGIIAEYVESEAIQNKLKRYGIDYSQGYLFSKPRPDIAEKL